MILTYYKGDKMPDPRIDEAIEWGNAILAPFASPDVFLAGGAFRSFFLGEKPEDIDLWFREERAHFEAQRVMSRTSIPLNHREGDGYADNWDCSGTKYQLVNFEFFPTLEETIKQFDFTICMCGMGIDYISFYEDYFEHLDNRKLVLNQLESPEQFLYRLQKYAAKGFTMDHPDDIIKAIDSIQIWDGKRAVKKNKVEEVPF